MIFTSQSCYWPSEKVIKRVGHRANYRKKRGLFILAISTLLAILTRMQMLDGDRIAFFEIFSDEEDIGIDTVI